MNIVANEWSQAETLSDGKQPVLETESKVLISVSFYTRRFIIHRRHQFRFDHFPNLKYQHHANVILCRTITKPKICDACESRSMGH